MVGVYANQASAEAGDRALEEFQFSADYAAEQPNPLAAVYLAKARVLKRIRELVAQLGR